MAKMLSWNSPPIRLPAKAVFLQSDGSRIFGYGPLVRAAREGFFLVLRGPRFMVEVSRSHGRLE